MNKNARNILAKSIIIFILIILAFAGYKLVRFSAYNDIDSHAVDANIQYASLPLAFQKYYYSHDERLPLMNNQKAVKHLLELSDEQYLDPISRSPWIFNSHLSNYSYSQIRRQFGDVSYVLAYSKPLNRYGDRLLVLMKSVNAISGEEFEAMKDHTPSRLDPIFEAVYHDQEMEHSYFLEVAFDPRYARKR